jgi:hypothetical protein
MLGQWLARTGPSPSHIPIRPKVDPIALAANRGRPWPRLTDPNICPSRRFHHNAPAGVLRCSSSCEGPHDFRPQRSEPAERAFAQRSQGAAATPRRRSQTRSQHPGPPHTADGQDFGEGSARRSRRGQEPGSRHTDLATAAPRPPLRNTIDRRRAEGTMVPRRAQAAGGGFRSRSRPASAVSPSWPAKAARMPSPARRAMPVGSGGGRRGVSVHGDRAALSSSRHVALLVFDRAPGGTECELQQKAASRIRLPKSSTVP